MDQDFTVTLFRYRGWYRSSLPVANKVITKDRLINAPFGVLKDKMKITENNQVRDGSYFLVFSGRGWFSKHATYAKSKRFTLIRVHNQLGVEGTAADLVGSLGMSFSNGELAVSYQPKPLSLGFKMTVTLYDAETGLSVGTSEPANSASEQSFTFDEIDDKRKYYAELVIKTGWWSKKVVYRTAPRAVCYIDQIASMLGGAQAVAAAGFGCIKTVAGAAGTLAGHAAKHATTAGKFVGENAHKLKNVKVHMRYGERD